jgi:Ca2+-transporting ATPase
METQAWHHLELTDVYRQLDTCPEGLTDAEVSGRLSRHGRNEIIRRKPVSPWILFFKQFANYFILVLLFAAILAFTVSFLPGQSGRRLTGWFILGIVLLSVALNFFEEYRARKELDALDRLLVFKTSVLRAGVSRQIDAAQVVPGDILVLGHGQKVPADARLVDAHSLRTDESALTGESVGVDKSPQPVALAAPLAERTSMVFASTFVTHGTGQAVAVSTGMDTQVGQIAGTLGQMVERPTPFQVEVQKMSRQMTVLVASLAVVVALILLFLL